MFSVVPNGTFVFRIRASFVFVWVGMSSIPILSLPHPHSHFPGRPEDCPQGGWYCRYFQSIDRKALINILTCQYIDSSGLTTCLVSHTSANSLISSFPGLQSLDPSPVYVTMHASNYGLACIHKHIASAHILSYQHAFSPNSSDMNTTILLDPVYKALGSVLQMDNTGQ